MRAWTTRLQRRVFVAMAAVAITAVIIDCGGTNVGPEKSNGITKITVTPAATGLVAPVDATPDPMGVTVYFIATSNGVPGVFSVPAAGGAVTMLYAGSPLSSPRGISVSSDGSTLYIADPDAGADLGGVIFTMPSAGDTPAPLAGTAGTHPTALDVFEDGGLDDLYFTGADATVLRRSAKTGMVSTLMQGAPLVSPDGIAVATDLTVYVADAQAGLALPGQVFALRDGAVSRIGPEIVPGSPAGLVVTLDDAKLLASSLAAGAGSSQVTVIQTVDGASSVFNDVIKQNDVSGGVHRARFKETYAWAGKTSVYTIKIKTILADSSSPGGVGG